MNIKNVVKVMNFHSLLRVERSREAAKKYTYLGDTVADMIDNIVNNRNIMLDFNIVFTLSFIGNYEFYSK